MRKETSCVRFCVVLHQKRRTERIIFCCRRYVAGPIFSLSFHPPAAPWCISWSLCVRVLSHGLILHVPRMHIFWFFLFVLSVLWLISREDEERDSRI